MQDRWQMSNMVCCFEALIVITYIWNNKYLTDLNKLQSSFVLYQNNLLQTRYVIIFNSEKEFSKMIRGEG